jgi:hypothetical protein
MAGHRMREWLAGVGFWLPRQVNDKKFYVFTPKLIIKEIVMIPYRHPFFEFIEMPTEGQKAFATNPFLL